MATTISFNQPNAQKVSYRYPNKLYETETDYVKFEFFKYKPPFTGSTTAQVTNGGEDVTFTNNGSLDFYNSSVINLQPDPELKTIFMYMPEDLSTSTSAEWAGKGFTNTATDILKVAGNAIGGSGPAQTADAIGKALGRLTQRGASVGASLLVQGMNALPGGITGDVNIQDVLGGIGGVILNPNTELMFGGFGLRKFTLDFKMAPRDEAEAKDIRAICNTFKKASLPSYSVTPDDIWKKTINFFNPNGKDNEDSNSNYIGIPSLCQVTFMSGPNPHAYVSQFKTCAITSVDINYTPDGAYATYGGGGGEKSPVATSIQLNFQETKLVFRQEININGATY